MACFGLPYNSRGPMPHPFVTKNAPHMPAWSGSGSRKQAWPKWWHTAILPTVQAQ